MEFIGAFVMGGLLCALAQVIVMRFKVAPPHLLTAFLIAGGVLAAAGIAGPLAAWGSTGFTAMIVGCGQAVYSTFTVLLAGNPVPFLIVMSVYLFLVVAGSIAGFIRHKLDMRRP